MKSDTDKAPADIQPEVILDDDDFPLKYDLSGIISMEPYWDVQDDAPVPKRDIRSVYDDYCSGELLELAVPPGVECSGGVISGTFRKLHDLIFIRSSECIYTVCGVHPGLNGLLEHLTHTDISVILRVWPKGGRLVYVFDIELDEQPGEIGCWISDSLFQQLMIRLLLGGERSVSDIREDVSFSRLHEIRFLLHAGANLFPEHIVRWANRQYALCTDPSKSREDRRHALTALDCVVNIDWNTRPPKLPPPRQARKMLDAEFYGLDAVKQRVMEIVSQIRRTNRPPKWGFLLSGPPGVGKSAVAQAIARIIGRPLIRLDMSSIGDSEGLTGSSRIYSNARPGLLIEQMRMFRTSNAVVCINELDKCDGVHGNPGTVLLTLLDGLGFSDVFLETSIPTNNLIFIATCNDPEKIPAPLRNRFLEIEIPAYTAAEKRHIFTDYVFPRALRASDVRRNALTLTEHAVDTLCGRYACEPGVRDLEQLGEKLVSHYVLQMELTGRKRYVCTARDLPGILGPNPMLDRHFSCRPGLVRSAFYHGGAAHDFPLEAAAVPGTGQFRAIGVGDGRQRDYCEAAFLCFRSCNPEFDLTKLDISVYVPQPIPDSPRNFVGVAAYAAIYSALTKTVLSDKMAFIGGCDICSNTFLDSSDATPYVEKLAGAGITTVFAPRGTGKLVFGDFGVRVLEYDDIDTMIKMAAYENEKLERAAG